MSYLKCGKFYSRELDIKRHGFRSFPRAAFLLVFLGHLLSCNTGRHRTRSVLAETITVAVEIGILNNFAYVGRNVQLHHFLPLIIYFIRGRKKEALHEGNRQQIRRDR